VARSHLKIQEGFPGAASRPFGEEPVIGLSSPIYSR
jgi:hypothetical protein